MMLLGGRLSQFTGIDSEILFWVGLVVGLNALLLASYSLV